MNRHRFVYQFIMILFLLIPCFALCQDEDLAHDFGWPQEILTERGRIVIYQPQVESFEGDRLEARTAVAVTLTGESNPVFGAMWFSARVATDYDERTVTLVDVSVPTVKFPQGETSDIDALSRLLETEIPEWHLVMSLDQLLTSLDMVATEKEMAANFNNQPPEIIFRMESSALVLIDGEPKLEAIENSKLKYVVNTPFFIVQDGKWFYLQGGGYWYRSKSIAGDWGHVEAPSKAVAQLAEKTRTDTEEIPPDTTANGKPVIPKIIVRTKPAELIQTNGEPGYASIEGTQLLYMSNTENDVIMDISTQTYYVLLAGRWYASKSLSRGPWAFVPNDELPKDFAQIPAKSDMGNVRPSVAGTQEAEEAVLENQIPQTTAIDRKRASLTVNYDGEPKFSRIEGTSMSYAVNTDKSVLRIGTRYYCCDEAVWFVGISPKGPWEVCTEVPEEVQSIPPECPVYNVKYVYIYDVTPEVVWVGYTPGYLHSYVYHGCVIYGTGWHYYPWYGRHYYPHPVTWGFGVHYNPWTGWGFSFGLNYGWLHVGYGYWRPPYYGWWGPAGYHYGYRHGYHHVYHHRYDSDHYAGSKARFRAGYKYPKRRDQITNVYRKRTKVVREIVDRARVPRASAMDRSRRYNNVYVDRDGTIHRKTDDGWQQRQNGRWRDEGRDASKKNREQTQQIDRTRPRRESQTSKQPAQRPDLKHAPTKQLTQRPDQGHKPSQQPIQRPHIDRSADRARSLERDSYIRSRGLERTREYQLYRKQYQEPPVPQRQPSERPQGRGSSRPKASGKDR